MTNDTKKRSIALAILNRLTGLVKDSKSLYTL